MTSRCEHWQALLADHAGHRLADRDVEALDRHLDACADCRAELAEWRGLRTQLGGLDEDLRIPMAERALAKVDALLLTGSQDPDAAAEIEPAGRWRKVALAAAALLLFGLGLSALQRAATERDPARSDARPAVEELDRGQARALRAPTTIARQARPEAALLQAPGARSSDARDPSDDPRSIDAGALADAMAGSAARDTRPTSRPATAGEGASSLTSEPSLPADPSTATPTHPSSAARSTEPPEQPEPPARPPDPVTVAPRWTATPAATPAPPTPEPTAAARIAGRVEDPEGKGLAWALVLLRPEPDDGRRFLLTDTAGDGSFALSLPAGRYRMVVEAEGFEPTWYGGAQPEILILRPDSTLQDLVVRLPKAAAPAPSPTPGGGTGSGPLPMPRSTATPDPDLGPGGGKRLPAHPEPPK